MAERLDDKVALVTGAGSGVGRAVLERFVAEGARVVAVGRGAERLRDAAEPLGDKVLAVPGDVTRYEDCERAVAGALDRFGRLDVLVANAGVYDERLRLANADPAQLSRAFDELFGVNVKGAMLAARAALDPLVEGRGSIIFTASISSVAAGFGGVLYVPAKHAVVGLSRQLALELAGRVRVNAVVLGYVHTDLRAAAALGGGHALSDPEEVAPRIPTGAAPRPQDVAGLYALLASDVDGSAITGSVFTADGGQLLHGPGPNWDRRSRA